MWYAIWCCHMPATIPPEAASEMSARNEIVPFDVTEVLFIGQGSALITCLRIRTLFRRLPTQALGRGPIVRVQLRPRSLCGLLDFVVPLDFASATGGFSMTLLINQATRLGFLLLYFTMSTIRDIKSKLNQKALDAVCTKYHNPASVHPSLPGLDKSILQSPDGMIRTGRGKESCGWRAQLLKKTETEHYGATPLREMMYQRRSYAKDAQKIIFVVENLQKKRKRKLIWMASGLALSKKVEDESIIFTS
ncbi:hypothetical protein Tco_1321664 [Tanacetum coccineum]